MITSIAFIWMLLITHSADANSRLIDTTDIANSYDYLLNEKIPVIANIVYPVMLAAHKEQTLDYIEQFSKNRRAYLLRTYSRGKKFFPKITTIFKKYNLPQELKVLIALESGFNANAVSTAGAVGYWQIMDPVAKEYGLKIIEKTSADQKKIVENNKNKKTTTHIDERKNLNKSTYVAARYLRDRCKNLKNDYLLIVASYNWGVGNVWNAMQKTGKSSPTFWDIKKYLPAETRSYVMNFIALNVIFHNYEKFAKNQLNFRSNITPDQQYKLLAKSIPGIEQAIHSFAR